MIVHARLHVLIGCLARRSLSTATFLNSFSATNGPFFALLLMFDPSLLLTTGYCLLRLRIHRLRTLLVRAELAAAQDQLFRLLLGVAGDAALGGHARLADRMAATVAATFTTAQRVVDRVHRLGTGVRANAP